MSMPTPGGGFAPQLHLSIPSTTTSFKRSFEQFGFDLEDSPIHNNGSSDPLNQSNSSVGGNGLHGPHTFHHHQGYGGSSLAGMPGTATASSSSRRPNDRTKRARSASSGTTSSGASASTDSSSSSSSSAQSSFSASTAAMERTSTALSPRSTLEHPPRLPTPDIDVDMPDVDGGHTSGPSQNPPVLSPTAGNSSMNFPDAYRLTLQSFHRPTSPTSAPVLPPLQLEQDDQIQPFAFSSLSEGDRETWGNGGAGSSAEPPRLHIDLPQPSLVPEDEEQQTSAEGSSTSVPEAPFYSHPDPPTLPPIPTADLFDDDRPAPSQPLVDHVPPSPSLHELRRWIDDADSDSSISGLARSDVADQGTSRVVLDESPTTSVAPSVPGPPTLQRLHESWQDFTSRMLQEDRSATQSENRFIGGMSGFGSRRSEGSGSASPENATAAVDEGSQINRRRRRLQLGQGLSAQLACDELFGASVFDAGRVSPTLPPLASASALLRGLPTSSGQDGASSSTSQGERSTSRQTRPSPVVSPFNRRMRRRLSLFDDDDDDMDGDHEEEIVAVPTRAPPRSSTVATVATGSSMTLGTSSAHQGTSGFGRRRPPSYRPLEIDLGSRRNSSLDESTSPFGVAPFSGPSLNTDPAGYSSSSDESEPVQEPRNTPYSGPFTFSTLAGNRSASSSRSGDASGNMQGHPRYRPVAFRSSSSSLVAENPSDMRRRDLARLSDLRSSTSIVNGQLRTGNQAVSSSSTSTHLGYLESTARRISEYDMGSSSNLGANNGSSTEDSGTLDSGAMMQVDDRDTSSTTQTSNLSSTTGPSARLPSVLPTRDSPTTNDTPVYLRDRYGNPVRYSSSMLREQTARNNTPGAARPRSPPSVSMRESLSSLPRYMLDYDFAASSSNSSSESSSANSPVTSAGAPAATVGPAPSTRPEETSSTTSNPPRSLYLPPPSLPSPNFDFSGLGHLADMSEDQMMSARLMSELFADPAVGPIATGPPSLASTIPASAEPTRQTTEDRAFPDRFEPYFRTEHRWDSDFSGRLERVGWEHDARLEELERILQERRDTERERRESREHETRSSFADAAGWHVRYRPPMPSGVSNPPQAHPPRQEQPSHVPTSLRGLGPSLGRRVPTGPGRVVNEHMLDDNLPALGFLDPQQSIGPQMYRNTTTQNPPGRAQPPQPEGSRTTTSTTAPTGNERTTANPTEDGDLASRFIPGPYRNTMRMLELERNAGEHARILREQRRRQMVSGNPLHSLHHEPIPSPFGNGSLSSQPPHRPTSPPPNLSSTRPTRTSAWTSGSLGRWGEVVYESSGGDDGNSAAPTIPPLPRHRTSSLSQFLNNRPGLERRESGAGQEGSNGGNATPAVPLQTQQPRPPLSLDLVDLAAMERRAYARIVHGRPPAPPPAAPAHPPSSGASGIHDGSVYTRYLHAMQPGGSFASAHPSASASTPTPPATSALGGARRFSGPEWQTRPFNQAIESLRDVNSGPQVVPGIPLSAAELLRRRRSAVAMGMAAEEGSGAAGAGAATGGVDAAGRRIGRFRHRGAFGGGEARRRLSGFSFADFMRDEDFDQSYEGLLSLGAIVGEAKPKSTPTNVIDSMEKAEYKDWANTDSDKRCPICLDDYTPTDPVMKLTHCSHWLHRDCLQQWLQGASTCPVCRNKVHGSTSSAPVRSSSTSAAQRLRTLSNRRLTRRMEAESSESSSSANTSSPAGPAPPGGPPRRDRPNRDDDEGGSGSSSGFAGFSTGLGSIYRYI